MNYFNKDAGELSLPGTTDPAMHGSLTEAVRAARSGRVVAITDPQEGGDIMARIVPAHPVNGPDRMSATVYGDSYEELIEAARAEARNFYGPDAPLGVEQVGVISNSFSSRGQYTTTVRIRCTRLPEGWDVP
jgi:hypothetical protein